MVYSSVNRIGGSVAVEFRLFVTTRARGKCFLRRPTDLMNEWTDQIKYVTSEKQWQMMGRQIHSASTYFTLMHMWLPSSGVIIKTFNCGSLTLRYSKKCDFGEKSSRMRAIKINFLKDHLRQWSRIRIILCTFTCTPTDALPICWSNSISYTYWFATIFWKLDIVPGYWLFCV